MATSLGRCSLGRVSLGAGLSYPWDGNANVAAFVPNAAHVSLNGGNVASILSTDGSYTCQQPSPTAQPAWSATSFNGHPGVTLDGVDDILYSTDAALLAFADGDDTPCTLITLVNVTASESGDTFAAFSNTTVTGQWYRHLRAGAGHRIDRIAHLTSGLQVVATGIQLLRAQSNGTEVRFFLNSVEDGASPQTKDAGVLTTTRYSIGSSYNGTTTPLSTYLGAVYGGWWVVKNHDTAAIAAIETWALARGGL